MIEMHNIYSCKAKERKERLYLNKMWKNCLRMLKDGWCSRLERGARGFQELDIHP